jgi:hypothetical protein
VLSKGLFKRFDGACDPLEVLVQGLDVGSTRKIQQAKNSLNGALHHGLQLRWWLEETVALAIGFAAWLLGVWAGSFAGIGCTHQAPDAILKIADPFAGVVHALA